VLKATVCSWLLATAIVVDFSNVISLVNNCVSVVTNGSGAGTLLPTSRILDCAVAAEVFSGMLDVTLSLNTQFVI
jgi:hypothetical protein